MSFFRSDVCRLSSRETIDRIGRAGGLVRLGFTLIEVLMTLLITSILVLGLHGIYRQAHTLWSVVEDERPLYELSDQVLECLRADLSGVYLPVLDGQAQAFVLVTEPDGSWELTFYTLSSGWRTSFMCARDARIRYHFTKGQTASQNMFERFEQWCAGEQVLAPEERDVLLTGPFNVGIQVVEPSADSSGGSSKTSYASKDRAPRAVKFSLQWQRQPGVAGPAFDLLVETPSESPIQERGAQQDANGPAAAGKTPGPWPLATRARDSMRWGGATAS